VIREHRSAGFIYLWSFEPIGGEEGGSANFMVVVAVNRKCDKVAVFRVLKLVDVKVFFS
jgi:hypothetical protein